MQLEQNAPVVWLTGLSGSGKTTLAQSVAAELWRDGRSSEILDGDELRKTFSRSLGFSREDRNENVARIAFVAELLSRNSVLTIVAAISPYRDARSQARALLPTFIEVYLAPPLDTCVKRDTKGLYARALSGQLPHFTGISDVYEEPDNPELVLDTSVMSISAATTSILSAIAASEARRAFCIRPQDNAA